ncbi:hypothetical protein [Undibacterium rugosum]|nr:hypothetical protein [Undibacterium rugosum]MBR7777955.1 hypothetical protein [Undibacterium rugosum]
MKQGKYVLATSLLAALSACGGGGGSTTATDNPQTPPSAATAAPVSVPIVVSDASSENWAAINITLVSLTLTDTNGKQTANLLSTPWSGNLEQLDNIASSLQAATLVSGSTYTGATLTISANPGDVSLVVASDPEPGFPEAANAVIPASRIQIQGAQGTTGALTVTVPVKLAQPFTAPQASSATNPTPTSNSGAINIEFDLDHPAFIVGHVPAAGAANIWSVNFNGPVRHKPVNDLTRLILNHQYATVTSVSPSINTVVFELNKATLSNGNYSATDTGKSLTASLDSSNGTLFYDLDTPANNATIKDFSNSAIVTALQQPGVYVRIACRYQQNGSLILTRIYASKSFSKVFISPEGHVIHVDSNAGTSFWMDQADGKPAKILIDPTTKFFFRNPNAASDATPIGSGSAFVSARNLLRGFKVKVTPADASANPLHASTVDIEAAPFNGRIGNVSTSGFNLGYQFNTSDDNYSSPLTYISSATANGFDPLNPSVAISGFKFWNYGFPTLITYTNAGTDAIKAFVATTGGANNAAISFGTAATAYYAQGQTYAVWGDAANKNGWSAPYAVLTPITIPRTSVSSALVAGTGSNQYSFGISAKGGTKPVTVYVSTASGSATLVYQVDRTKDVVSITPQDITSSAGLSALQTALATSGVRIEVTGIPQADGSLKGSTVKYYTGTQPSSDR